MSMFRTTGSVNRKGVYQGELLRWVCKLWRIWSHIYPCYSWYVNYGKYGHMDWCANYGEYGCMDLLPVY